MFRKTVDKIQVAPIKDILHEDQHTFMIISRSFLLRMRNVSDKGCRESEHTFYIQYLLFVDRAIYGKIWKKVVEQGTPQMTLMTHACCMLDN